MTSTSTSGSNSGASAGDGNTNGSASGSGSNHAAHNSIELEYNRYPDRNAWLRFYQDIREKCDREANEKHFGTSESDKSHNRSLNRYRDVNPYDHSRIILHRGCVDYINANLVKLERADRKYILTQGPLNTTVGHFWLMVWEQNTKAVLMLNKIMEKKQIKCHMYWPDRKGADNALRLHEVKLTVEFLRCEEYKNYSRRWFKLTDLESKQSREIIQFHYMTWPDFGVPSSPVAFLQFLKQVRDSGALDPNVGPAVVHCSAGIGRSGTFCLVDCCLVLIDKEGENSVSVQDVLYELRRYRMGLIQTSDQLSFSYQAIIEGIKLLKDSNFLEYNEAPIIINSDADDDQRRSEHFNLDETPPPLPPRTHSLPITAGSGVPCTGVGGSGALILNLRGAQTKPLPKIPTSESYNDDLYAQQQQLTEPNQNSNHNNKNNKDALNNFINSEKNANVNAAAAAATDNSMSNRPLPPLPPQQQQQQKQQNSLDRVHESESDENELYEDEDDASDDAIADNNDIDNDNQDDNDDAKNTVCNANNVSRDQKKAGESDGDVLKSNGIEGGASSSSKSPENELRRRKRVERQAFIEQKVNEIKRKQREAEDGKQSAKKRRSLITYIAAGVIVGVICVYAYTKLA